MNRLFWLLGLWPTLALAQEDATALAQKALEQNLLATNNARAELTLTVSKDGKVVRERRLSSKIRRSNDQVQAWVEFAAPPEVAGTRFLSKGQPGQGTEQYVYLPAFKKVKRIVGAQRSSSFMGTDFSYRDLDGRQVSDADWKKLPDQKVADQNCLVLEGTVKDTEEDYGRLVLWVHPEHWVPMKVEFYDRHGELEKRFTVRKLERRGDRHVAVDAVMATPKKGTETRITLGQLDLNAKFTDADFSRAALER